MSLLNTQHSTLNTQHSKLNTRLAASYRLIDGVPPARADTALVLRVAVRNTGLATWPHTGAHPVNLSYHWLDRQGGPVDFEGLRAIFDAPVRPDGEAVVELQVEPPPRAGDYLLALDLVEEGVGWFSLQGAAPLIVPVTVAPAPPDLPRACVINGNCMINDALGNHVVNQLRFLQRCGYQAIGLVEHIDPRHPADLRQHLARVTLDELRGGPANPQTRRAVRLFQSADLYIFNYSTYYQLVEAIRLVSRGALIFDYHGVTPPRLWEGPGGAGLREGLRNLRLARFADYVIAHSEFTSAELLATQAIDPARLFRMPYIVPLARFSPGGRDPALLARYGLAADQPLLLYVGRMAGNKRVQDLVRALALVRGQLPGTALLLVGNTRIPAHALVVAQTRQLATELGVADGVIFTGSVPDVELPAHYRLADLFVTASLHEGFCIPVIEAMACGVPVIGAHATALPETIGDGGLTFHPLDPAHLAQQVLRVLRTKNQEPRTENQEPRTEN